MFAEGADLDALMTDESGQRHESIPPPLIRKVHIEALRSAGARDLPPQFAEVVLRADRHLLQPIYDVESENIAFGHVALIGDAAFVARPHVGVGVLKAAQDAAALARSLDEAASVPEALRAMNASACSPISTPSNSDAISAPSSSAA